MRKRRQSDNQLLFLGGILLLTAILVSSKPRYLMIVGTW